MTTTELITAIRAHALNNYERGGWDYLVECWDDEDILEAIGNRRTLKGALRECRKTLGLLDERRREVRAESGEYY